jgi:hypothetical protein
VNALIAGAATGFLMASVFACVGVVMLFSVVRDPPPALQTILEKLPPGGYILPVIVLSYPVWGAVGVVMAFLFTVSSEQAPGTGIGSPNLVFTAAVLIATAMLALPVAILLRRVLPGLLTMVFAFVGVFGWLLPYLAT